MNHKPWGFSFSGGGLSALAYAGFADELSDHGIVPDVYAGLSGGAIVATVLASGLNSQDAKSLFLNLTSISMINVHPKKLEIVDHSKLIDKFRSLLPYQRFEDLPRKLAIFATDLTKRDTAMIQSGDLASAIVASCSVFPLLQPIKRRGLLLADGGFTVYYGAEYLRRIGCSKVIGVDVTGLTEGTVGGILSALYKQINSSTTSNNRYELEVHPVDVDIRISFPTPSFYNFSSKTDKLLSLGRNSAKTHLRHISKVLGDNEETKTKR